MTKKWVQFFTLFFLTVSLSMAQSGSDPVTAANNLKVYVVQFIAAIGGVIFIFLGLRALGEGGRAWGSLIGGAIMLYIVSHPDAIYNVIARF